MFPIRGENVEEDPRVITTVLLLEFGEVDHRSIHGVSVWILASNPGVGVGVARSTDDYEITFVEVFHWGITV